MKEVPAEWWRAACEQVTQPLACVNLENKFIWANRAYEQLVGYSLVELCDMTWMDITVIEDVGGDLASVNAMAKGNIPEYALAKKYKHKFGTEIPVQLSVWRFPREIHEVLVCFIIEAPRSPIMELTDVIEELDSLKRRLDIEEKKSNGVNVRVGDEAGRDYTGRDKTINGWVPFLVGLIFSGMGILILFLLYILINKQ